MQPHPGRSDAQVERLRQLSKVRKAKGPDELITARFALDEDQIGPLGNFLKMVPMASTASGVKEMNARLESNGSALRLTSPRASSALIHRIVVDDGFWVLKQSALP